MMFNSWKNRPHRQYLSGAWHIRILSQTQFFTGISLLSSNAISLNHFIRDEKHDLTIFERWRKGIPLFLLRLLLVAAFCSISKGFLLLDEAVWTIIPTKCKLEPKWIIPWLTSVSLPYQAAAASYCLYSNLLKSN